MVAGPGVRGWRLGGQSAAGVTAAGLERHGPVRKDVSPPPSPSGERARGIPEEAHFLGPHARAEKGVTPSRRNFIGEKRSKGAARGDALRHSTWNAGIPSAEKKG